MDKHGEEIEDRIYNQRDFDRDSRARAAHQARRREGHRVPARAPTASTRPSCSARTSTTPSGCGRRSSTRTPTSARRTASTSMRITGDNPEGKAELDNFIHPEERYPVIVTTSKLLTTGVDCTDLQGHRARPDASSR